MSDHLVGVASLVTGIPGLVEVCLHLGDFVVQRLGAYQKADEAISDIVLKLSTYWDIQKAGLAKLHKIATSATLTREVDERMVQILERLRHLLHKAATLLAKYTSPNPIGSAAGPDFSTEALKRLRFILFEEKQLAQLLEQISGWESLFNKRLVLLAEKASFKSTSSETSEAYSDKAVSAFRMPLMRPEKAGRGRNYELAPEEYVLGTLRQFEAGCEWAESSGIYIPSNRSDIIIERYDTHTAIRPYEEVAALASLLHSSQAELMHILPCQGFYEGKVPENDGSSDVALNLVFKLPFRATDTKYITSLRKHFLGHSRMTINTQLRVAIDLATAVWYVHSGQTVHKSIRPETIYLAVDQSTENVSLYLGGFTRFREKTLRLSNDLHAGERSGAKERSKSTPSTVLWEEKAPFVLSGSCTRLLYRHPDRWGSKANQSFTMLHDIYSLGVILIEIGRQKSLCASGRRPLACTPKLMSSLARATDALQKGDYVGLAVEAEHVKKTLISYAQQCLPFCMGVKYTEVVVCCLTGLEGYLATPGESPSVLLGPAYMEKVLEKLEQINV